MVMNHDNYIRWIHLNKSNHIKIPICAFIYYMKINDVGLHIKLRSVTGRYLQLRMDEIFLFRKMTDNEMIV